MCGIAGILVKRKGLSCSETMLRVMNDTMDHRGPDQEGIYITSRLGLAHKRLSIIDIKSGRQPMSNEDNTIHIVYNGEIYNHRELRKDLIARGHTFKTDADTESILHLYEEKGEMCVHELNGMFAFAIWDENKRSLFLARDRMGIKPLYYHESDDYFTFASEIKAILARGDISPEMNLDKLHEYAVFRDVSGENTMFKDVYRLEAGHIAVVNECGVKVKKYWDVIDGDDDYGGSFKEAVEKIDHLLADSVKIRLMSDVPLGTFCSGGLDSSLVTAISARYHQGPLNTFSVGFDEAMYDETMYAEQVSRALGTTHHIERIGNVEFSEMLPELAYKNDDPLNFANSIQIFAISKLARSYVTVVLTGEGADELFGGYPRYHLINIGKHFDKMPSCFRSFLNKVEFKSRFRKIEKIKKVINQEGAVRALLNSSNLDPAVALNLFEINNDSMRELEESVNDRFVSNGNVHPVKAALIQDQKNYLVSILNRQDKMSMAASIESRVPFLDYRLVRFVNSLPVNYRLRLHHTKYVLKRMAENWLPKAIVYRKKSGFGVPLREWFMKKEGVGALFPELINDSNDVFPLKRDILEKCYAEHQTGRVDHSELLWTALSIILWKKAFNIAS